MINRLILFVLIIAHSILSFANESQYESVVKAQFPKSLIDSFYKKNPRLTETDHRWKLFSYVVADFNGDGEPVIVAAYSNYDETVLSLMELDGRAISSIENFPDNGGYTIDLRTYDLDSDGKPELHFQSWSGANMKSPTLDFILLCDESELVIISPTNYEDIFRQGGVYDEDGDGILEIFDRYTMKSGMEQHNVYHLIEDKLQFVETTSYHKDYKLYRGVNKHPLLITKPGDHELIIDFGLAYDRAEVDAATILINGEIVLDPAENWTSKKELTKIVKLQKVNSIEVILEGIPAAGIHLTINPVMTLFPDL